jgi:hypothetical protein
MANMGTPRATSRPGLSAIFTSALRDTWEDIVHRKVRSLVLWVAFTVTSLFLRWVFWGAGPMRSGVQVLLSGLVAGALLFVAIALWRVGRDVWRYYLRPTRRDILVFVSGLVLGVLGVCSWVVLRREPRIDTSRPRLVGYVQGKPQLFSLPNNDGASMIVFEVGIWNSGLPSVVKDWNVYIARQGGAARAVDNLGKPGRESRI